MCHKTDTKVNETESPPPQRSQSARVALYTAESHGKQLLGIEAGYKASTPQRFTEWISKTIHLYLPAKEADFTLMYLWKRVSPPTMKNFYCTT